MRVSSKLRRRDLLVRAAQLGVGLPAGALLGAACGGSSSGGSSGGSSAAAPIKGTPVLLNYSGWMGKHIVSSFEARYPAAGLKQVPEASISNGAVVPALKANLSTYDAALGDQAVVGQAIVVAPAALRERVRLRETWERRRGAVIGVGILSRLSYILVLTALVVSPVSYVAPAREIGILIGAVMGARLLAEGHLARRAIGATAMVAGIVALALG